MLLLMKVLGNRHGVTWQQALPYILIIGSSVGLAASFMLSYDKIHYLQNPAYRPSCNLNPILSCGSVMKTAQANLFGVPNTLFGIMAFSMAAMLGIVLLSGAQLSRRLWLGVQAAATAGIIFMHYLFFESTFRIHAICPWCFGVWMITLPIFFAITLHNIRSGNLPSTALTRFVAKYSTDLLVLWYGIIFAVLLTRFWYYWRTLLW